MKEITLNIDGKEIKATVSEEEIEKLTKKEWPQRGDKYWYLYDFGIKPFSGTYADDNADRARREVGNMYRTKQEALDAIRAQKLIAAIAKRRKELNGDWVLDWNGPERAYFIYFCRSGLTHNWYMDANYASPFGYFKSIEIAHTIIEEFRDELTWYFTEYTVSVN